MAAVEWALSGFGDEIDPDPAMQIAVLNALGARHIEVRSAWDTNVVDLGDDQLAVLSELLGNAGMAVSAIGSPIGKVGALVDPEQELARLRRVIRVAHELDTGFIRVFSFYPPESRRPEEVRDEVLLRMSLLTREAEREGVVLLHENEKEIYGDVPERVLDLVESVGSASLQLAWDSANFVQVGVRPFTEAYPLLRQHIAYLQVKDALLATGEVVPAGRGDGELLETLTALRDDGYRGVASLEPHLQAAFQTGGFSGPWAFGVAARAFAGLLAEIGVATR